MRKLTTEIVHSNLAKKLGLFIWVIFLSPLKQLNLGRPRMVLSLWNYNESSTFLSSHHCICKCSCNKLGVFFFCLSMLNFWLRFEHILITISTVKKGPPCQGSFSYSGTSCSYIHIGAQNTSCIGSILSLTFYLKVICMHKSFLQQEMYVSPR